MVRLVGAVQSHEAGTGCRTARCDRLICEKLGEKSMGSSETGPKGVIFPWKFPATVTELKTSKGFIFPKEFLENLYQSQFLARGSLIDGRGSKVNFITPLLGVQAVFAVRNPAPSVTSGVYVMQTPLLAKAVFCSPNPARTFKNGVHLTVITAYSLRSGVLMRKPRSYDFMRRSCEQPRCYA
jgi:hypothetical protein